MSYSFNSQHPRTITSQVLLQNPLFHLQHHHPAYTMTISHRHIAFARAVPGLVWAWSVRSMCDSGAFQPRRSIFDLRLVAGLRCRLLLAIRQPSHILYRDQLRVVGLRPPRGASGGALYSFRYPILLQDLCLLQDSSEHSSGPSLGQTRTTPLDHPVGRLL